MALFLTAQRFHPQHQQAEQSLLEKAVLLVNGKQIHEPRPRLVSNI
jgi:hypothetical protein